MDTLSKLAYHKLLGIAVEEVTRESIKKFRIDYIKKKIDDTLLNGNKEEFIMLTEELKCYIMMK